MRYLFLLVSLLILGITSCQKKYKKAFLNQVVVQDYQNIPAPYNAPDAKRKNPCRDQANYIPNPEYIDHTPVKHIRVNFHIMCNEKRINTFTEPRWRAYIVHIMKITNRKLKSNKKMNLPPGNNTPVIEQRYQYRLFGLPDDPEDDGIYFHYDNELYFMIAGGRDQNNFDKTVFNKYGVQKDSVLNVFVMSEHLDSLKSKTYIPANRGVGFGRWSKVIRFYENAQDTVIQHGQIEMPKSYDSMRLLNHEIGHCYGLRHTWSGNDGCKDTPNHPNCWNKEKRPPCDTMWSNNFMDSNAHSSAWSPCQIGRMHYNMQNRALNRAQLIPTWCNYDPEKLIDINTAIEWYGAKDIESDILIGPNGSLRIACKVSLPTGARIKIWPGGKLIIDGGRLYNDCGGKWEGIEILKKSGLQGEVVLSKDGSIEDTKNEVEIVKEQART